LKSPSTTKRTARQSGLNSLRPQPFRPMGFACVIIVSVLCALGLVVV